MTYLNRKLKHCVTAKLIFAASGWDCVYGERSTLIFKDKFAKRLSIYRLISNDVVGQNTQKKPLNGRHSGSTAGYLISFNLDKQLHVKFLWEIE